MLFSLLLVLAIGKPRTRNLQALQIHFQSIIATKDFVPFIYCLSFVTSHLCLKFALIPIICQALEHVFKFLTRNFSRSTLYRKEEVDSFSKLREFLDKFLKSLFVIISLKATTIWGEFSTKHPHVMRLMVLTIVLCYLVGLLGTMVGHHIERLPKVLSWMMFVMGSISLVLVLTTIDVFIAWLTLVFLIGIFALSVYDNSEELNQVFFYPVSNMNKNVIESYRGHTSQVSDLISNLIESYRGRNTPLPESRV